MFRKAQYDAEGRIIGVVDSIERYINVDDEFMADGLYVDVSQEPHVIKEQIDYPAEYEIAGRLVTVTGIPEGLTISLDGVEKTSTGEIVELEAINLGLTTLTVKGPVSYVRKDFDLIIEDDTNGRRTQQLDEFSEPDR